MEGKRISQMKYCKYIFVVLVALSVQHSFAQKSPFYNEVANFKKQDSMAPPPSNAILFIGSSSFTMWKDVKEYFPGKQIINRGFGGSSLSHLIQYFDQVVQPYKPKQVVIYCGENDLTVDTVSPELVFYRFMQLFSMLRQLDNDLPIVYISIKPSPSRQSLMSRMEVTNKLIKKFLKKQPYTIFVDVYHAMLKRGEPDESLFIADRLHMNAKGYHIWQRKLQPVLLK